MGAGSLVPARRLAAHCMHSNVSLLARPNCGCSEAPSHAASPEGRRPADASAAGPPRRSCKEPRATLRGRLALDGRPVPAINILGPAVNSPGPAVKGLGRAKKPSAGGRQGWSAGVSTWASSRRSSCAHAAH
eukprot:scaffold19114_cov118-Isochrysis_galbana.AAC.1